MSAALTIPVDPTILERVDALAAARETTREAIVEMALEGFLFEAELNGNELPPLQDWQLREIEEGLAAADRGEFATDEEVEAVFSKYRG